MRDVLFTMVTMAIAVTLCVVLANWFLPSGGTLLVLQLAAVSCAVQFSRFNGIVASLVAACSFNFFFTEPRYSIRMSNIDDVINMGTFVVVAVFSSELILFYKRQQKALRIAQLQANVLRSVSHDLRTPISSIIGSMETLDTYYSSLKEEDKRELISGSIHESKRLHAYIENILQATKIQSDLLIAGREKISLKCVVENLLLRFNTPRISVTYKLSCEYIYASGPLLEQALFNVVDNALKFSKETVSLTVINSTDSTTIIVDDLGEGLPNNDTEAPFTLFSSSRHGDIGQGGIGLGLHVARGIINAHKGTLSLQNLDSGCRATFSLPHLNRPRT